MDHATKLKFSIYVQLSHINKMFQYRFARVILYIVEVIIFEHGCYISALEYIRMLMLSSYVLVAGIDTIYKYGHEWVILLG